MHRAIGSRTVNEHVAWDTKSRSDVQKYTIDSVASTLHEQPGVTPELTKTDLRTVEELPPLDIGTLPDASTNTEVRALELGGVVKTDGKHILVPNPGRLLSGIVALLADEAIWRAYLAQCHLSDAFDEVLAPVRTRLHTIDTKSKLLKLSYKIARFYGVSVSTVKAEFIYRGAPEFVARAGVGTALTLSTSSGIIDPLERFGTDELLKLLNLPNDSPVAQKLRPKSAWRVMNFSEGLLNPRFQARRLYFFDSVATRRALTATLDVLPEEKKAQYMALAARMLCDALKCPGFELYEVQSFQPWMWRYTRSAPGHVLISFRHPQTKAIREGLEFNFTNPERLHRWFSAAFLATTAFPVPAIQAAAIIAGLLESTYFDMLRQTVFGRQTEAELASVSRRIRLQAIDENAKLEAASSEIEALIANRP